MTKPLNSEQRDQILALLEQGQDRKTIASSVGVSAGQVSAIAAHRKMGTYTEKFLRQSPNRQTHKGKLLEIRKPKASSMERRPDGSILIGTDVQSGVPYYWNPNSREGGAANPHVLILGESGFGKTYSTSCLLAELVESNIPSIVFDYGQGFSTTTSTAAFRQYAKPIEFELSRDGIAINPLEIFPVDLHGPATVAQRIADTFARVYPRIGVQQHSVIRQAVLEVLYDAGIKPHDRATWKLRAPHFRNVERKLADIANEVGAPNRRVALAAASHISTLFVFDTFRSTGHKLSWGDLIGGNEAHTWILQLGGLESSVERAVTEFMLWNLMRFVEVQGPGPLRCFIVLDEAHKMSFAADSPVEKLLREGRKFGLGLILASQQPEDFSAVAFANTATKVVFQVTDERGAVSRRLAKKAMKGDVGSLPADVITQLPKGIAYVVTENVGRVVKISSFEDRVREWSRAPHDVSR